MAKAADAGHRVVLVVATRGEQGEPVPGVLADGEQLSLRRTAEAYESAAVLGVDRVEFLGYVDSGMMGEPTNDEPWSFWQADVEQAAEPPRRHPPRGGGRRRSPSTTTTAATATPTTSRCTGSARGPPSWPASRGLPGDDQPRPRSAGDGARREAESTPRAASRRPTLESRRLRQARGGDHPRRRRRAEYVDRKRASMLAHRSQIGRRPLLPRRCPTRSSPLAFGQSSGTSRRDRPAPAVARRTLIRAASADRCLMAARPWTHTGYTQQIMFGAGPVARAAELAARPSGPRRVLLVTTAGRRDSDDGRGVRAVARPGARVDVRRGRVARAGAARAAGGAPGPPRRRWTRVVSLRRRLVRRPRQGGVLLHRAGAGHAGRVVRRPAGRCRTSSIPTTYSGAELTPFFGMTDPSTRQKSGAGGPTIAPMAAIYDPELTLDTPPRVSAETGMNALAHCVEVGVVAAAGRRRPRRSPSAGAGAAGRRAAAGGRRPDDLDGPHRRCWPARAWPAGACRTRRWASTTGWPSSSAAAPGSPTGWPTRCILPHAMRSTPRPSRRASPHRRGHRRTGRPGRGGRPRSSSGSACRRRLSECGVHRRRPRRGRRGRRRATATSPPTRARSTRPTPAPSSPPYDATARARTTGGARTTVVPSHARGSKA